MPPKVAKYSTQQLLNAVGEVRHGTLSLRKASRKYGVPVMTIQDRVKGKTDDVVSQGRPTVLPAEVEDHLVIKLKNAAVKGFGVTRRMLAVQVGRMTRRLKLKTPFRNGVPGKDWVSGFIKRHPDITIRSPTALSTVRARMLNPTVTNNYFEGLASVVNCLNLSDKPHLIWNMDETSVPLVHKPSRVLAETGVKNIPGRVGNCRDNVSVLACVSASGRDIPPFVIVKGKTQKSLYAYNTKEGVPGSKYTYQERAWMEDTLGELWFSQHFLQHCGEERPQLLILDSHSSHETVGLIDAARENNITLLAIPPHTTQWLCPLDKSVFGPFSREYSRVCSEFMAENPNNMVSKWEWPRLFCSAYKKAFSPDNIASGFRKCGIYPVCPDAIPKNAVAPSIPFDAPECTQTESQCLTIHKLPAQTQQLPAQPRPLPVSTKQLSLEPHPLPVQSQLLAIESPPNDTDFSIVSESEFIGSVLSGEISYTTNADGNIEIELPVGGADDLAMGYSVSEIFTEPMVSSSSTMMKEIDQLFHLPAPEKNKKPSVRKITSHRILTSDEIFNKKVEVREKKERENKEKEERKQARMAKGKSVKKSHL